MKKLCLAFITFLALLTGACSHDSDETPTVENKIVDVGEKWTVTSAKYTIIDQGLGGQGVKTGTQADAGAFYFNGTSGTFDILVAGYHKEDVFNFTQSSSSVSITTVTQSVSGASVSQYVIALSGDKTSTTKMTLDGTITSQSLTGQFVMTATYTLEKL